MTSTNIDRIDGLVSSTAVKGPCKATSSTNITLSGEQTIDGVAVVEGDRVLVNGQTDGRENGIYVASTGAWRRSKDFSSNNDIRTGTAVRVNSGTNAGGWVLTTADPVTIDTSTITFTRDSALTGALAAINNLSDVSSAVAALWNLRNNGANIASAATLVLDDATGDQVDVTGAVTITAVTLAEDREVWVRFTGAPQITVGASLIGNGGGSNITMAAGDIARFRGYAAGVVRFTVFRVSGQAVAAPATTTEVLTGTDTSKPVTADALAALWEKGADVASSGTISLGEGSLFHITGTTTITDIDFATPKDGRRATLIFDAALTLTHNATTLRLPGGANITTAANDRCVVVQDNSDNVYVESYTKADGTAVVGMTLLAAVATTSGAGTTGKSLSFPAGTKKITFMCSGISSSAIANAYIRLGDAGGAESSGYTNYGIAYTGTVGLYTESTSQFPIGAIASAAVTLTATIELTLMEASSNKWQVSIASNASNTYTYFVSGSKALSAELTTVTVYFDAGNFDAGSISAVYSL